MKKFLSLALGAAVAVAAPAAAETDLATETRAVEVTYHDLNLAHASGAARLETRIRSAARSICGEPQKSVAALQAARQCRVAAVESARPQLELALDRARRGTVEVASAQSISVKRAASR